MFSMLIGIPDICSALLHKFLAKGIAMREYGDQLRCFHSRSLMEWNAKFIVFMETAVHQPHSNETPVISSHSRINFSCSDTSSAEGLDLVACL